MVYPPVKRQRYWVHKLRNVANSLPVRYREDCLKGARKIYLAKTRLRRSNHLRFGSGDGLN